MNKKMIIIGLIALVAIGFIYYKQARTSNQIVVGVIAPLSGPFSAFGDEIKKGIELAKVPGIKIVYEDDNCDPKTAISAYKKLTELDGATIILGPACGAPQKSVAPLMKNSNVIGLTSSAAPRELYSLSGGKMFDIQYSLEDESGFLANKMYDLGYKNVAIVTYQNAFSEVNSKSFKENYKGTIVTTISLDDNSTTIDTDLLKLSGQKFDAIYVTDLSFFFASGIEKLKINKIKVPVFTQYAAELPVARSLVEGAIYSFPKDVLGDDGGIKTLAKASADMVFPIALTCKGDTNCIKETLLKTQNLDQYGVIKRDIILKQIVNSKVQIYNK